MFDTDGATGDVPMADRVRERNQESESVRATAREGSGHCERVRDSEGSRGKIGVWFLVVWVEVSI